MLKSSYLEKLQPYILYPTNLRKTEFLYGFFFNLDFKEHRFPEHLKKQPPEVIKRAVFKNFAVFTGKHLCWSLFLIKLQTFRLIAPAKSWSVRGVFHQPAFMGSCLTINHTCLYCLPST